MTDILDRATHIVHTEATMSSTDFAPAVLYTFTAESEDGIKTIQVARLMGDIPDDWMDWPKRYIQDHPGLELQGIAGIRFVDERPQRLEADDEHAMG